MAGILLFGLILSFSWTTSVENAKEGCGKNVWNNVMLLDGICTDCPPGHYGVNCTERCPSGYYGYECISKCGCERGSFCHVVWGCVSRNSNWSLLYIDPQTNNWTTSVPKVERKWTLTINQWFHISIVLFVMNIILLFIGVIVCVFARSSCSKEEYRPLQIIDLLTRLTHETDNIGNVQLSGVDQQNGNQYIEHNTSVPPEDRSLLMPTMPNCSATRSPASDESVDGEHMYMYMTPGSMPRDLSTSVCTGKTDTNGGYNVLSLKTSISEVNSDGLKDIHNSTREKGKGKGKGKSKTLERIPKQPEALRQHHHLVRHRSMQDPKYRHNSFGDAGEIDSHEYFILEKNENCQRNINFCDGIENRGEDYHDELNTAEREQVEGAQRS